MSKQQEAMRLALEALELVTDLTNHDDEIYDAITALRAALAEPVQEPVAWLWQHRETGRTRVLMPDERTATDVAAAWDVVGPLYLAPPQRTAEPRAWLHTDPDKPRVKFLEWREDEPGYRGRWIKTPLYAAPPQRKPLTEEEIDKIVAEHVRITDQNLSGAVYMAMRDLEAAHGIGGQP